MDICETCFTHLPRNRAYCYRCGISLVSVPREGMICGNCQKKPPYFDATHAPFLHQDAIRYLITGLKFHRQFANARLLALLMAESLKNLPDMPERIIPIPLHPKRYRERGFNQAIEIARTLSRELVIPLNYKNCIRSRNTPHQIGLPAGQRRKNLRNAFELVKPIEAEHVALFDDVITTGTTASELAKILKKAGIAKVEVWACARA
ncbi:MAG: ComF family protein [Methylomicrobium sp.]